MIVLVVSSVIVVTAGVFYLTEATMGVGFVALGCYFGILARIAQASSHAEKIVEMRQQQQAPPEDADREETAYAVYSAMSEACEECKKLDGLHVLLTYAAYRQTKIPNPGCTHERGCTCSWAYVNRDEQGSAEVVSFLQKNRGSATEEQVREFRK